MNKRERKKKEGNVIFFPDLEKRLLEKGLEYLQNKKFHQAIELFEEAKTLAPENKDVNVGLVLAYYEAGALAKAKKLSKEMLKEGIGEYFETVDFYLMILVQLHEYEEIIATIEVLFEEKEVPEEKIEHFSKMLEFSKRMALEKRYEHENQEEDMVEESPSLHLFENEDPNSQVLAIAQLATENIRPYIEEVKMYLHNPDGHPFLKTMLVNILREQEFDKKLQIEKFGWKKDIVPVDLFSLHEDVQRKDIQMELHRHLENEDPILLEQINSLLDRHLFLIYPFPLIPDNTSIWAAAYHAVGLEFNSGERYIENLEELYGIDGTSIDEACVFIKKLEEISYPNI